MRRLTPALCLALLVSGALAYRAHRGEAVRVLADRVCMVQDRVFPTVSGRTVDKASAVTAQMPDGSFLDFGSEETFRQFNEGHQRAPSHLSIHRGEVGSLGRSQ